MFVEAENHKESNCLSIYAQEMPALNKWRTPLNTTLLPWLKLNVVVALN